MSAVLINDQEQPLTKTVKLQLLAFLMVSLAITMVACGDVKRDKRPNFLLIITDDQSWIHTSYTREPGLSTPNFERIANEGVYFERAYAPSPTCTASRSGILSGQHSWRTGAGSVLWGEYPSDLINYQEILLNEGYEIGFTGKGWGPGLNRGKLQDPAGKPIHVITDRNPPGMSKHDYVAAFKSFLDDRDRSKPFSFWVGFVEPHRPYQTSTGSKNGEVAKKLNVPDFLADHPIVRNDIEHYINEINWLDARLGEILSDLEKAGELDNTVIVFTSDNGMPFPRAKSNNYDYGVRVPMAIRYGQKVKERVIATPVSLTDIAPTFLALAGIAIPSQMTGKSLADVLVGIAPPVVQHGAQDAVVYTAFNRHIDSARPNNAGYPVRAIHSKDFTYLINYSPELYPAGDADRFADIDEQSPTKNYMFGSKVNQGKFPNRLSIQKRPAEELYDLNKDHFQLTNLAEEPEYVEIKARLKAQLLQELKSTGDPLIELGPSYIQHYPYHER